LESDIVKIVYFDEGSATDYIQMYNGGSLYYEAESTEADTKDGSAGLKTKAGIGTKLRGFLFRGSIDLDGSIGTSFEDDTVMRSVLTNTVLTDFLEAVDEQDGRQTPIHTFSNRRIAQIPGSLSTMSLLTPYLSMAKSGQGVSAGEFDIAIDKLDSTLNNAKGYLEFLGIQKGCQDIILRFNAKAFKNNYRPSNLQRMRLKLYAVYVGRNKLSDLMVANELSVEGFDSETNPEYPEPGATEKPQDDTLLAMYDVILAGVRANGAR
jgi:hypothetical protein